jgi:hypothetical protein
VRLPAAVFLVDLRVAAAEPALFVLRRFAFARLVVVLPRPAAAFFVVERFLGLRGFSVPVTASAMLVAAPDIPSTAASMLVLAASAIVPRTPSFSLSMLFTSLPCLHVSVALSLGIGQLNPMRRVCRLWDVGRVLCLDLVDALVRHHERNA